MRLVISSLCPVRYLYETNDDQVQVPGDAAEDLGDTQGMDRTTTYISE